MDIEKEISELESIIEQYEDTNNTEDRMDFRQTAQKKIKNLRTSIVNGDLDKEEEETIVELLNEFEEVLSY